MLKHASAFILFFACLFTGLKLNAEKYKSPDYVRYANEIISSFAKQIKKEFGLDCESSGGSMPYDVEEISISFAAYQRATIEEARELEVKITEKFVEMINKHEKIRPFLREYPFPSSRTTVAISFHKKNNSRYTDGSVSYVSQVRNNLYYCAEDPNNRYRFIDLKEEPYEEALKIVQPK